jgi:cell volume regulation protein A
MHDVVPFGLVLGVVALAGLAAVWSNRISERVRVPAPAIFLVAAAFAAALAPELRDFSIVGVQRVVTVMLVLLLFDGGMHIGVRRFRAAAGAILWIGVAGTVVTSVGVALLAHVVFGLDWRSALLIGVAVAPTDPAVVFSVLGRQEVGGRSGTLLEGESGANDPVGIAAMTALLAAGTGAGAIVSGVAEFAFQMVVGAAVGLGGGWALSFVMRRVPLPNGALYPLQTLLGAGAVYGLTAAAHGSGFLAVFVAGIVVGDVRAPYKAEIERFHSSLASLAEIVAFAVLGFTVSYSNIVEGDRLVVGLGLAVLLTLVVRPVLVGMLLLAVRLTGGERLFVMWAGLKGAVPLLLGTYLLTEHVDQADRLYAIVIVVVVFSVVVQGGLVPTVARLAGVPMRMVEPEPWALGMRFRDEPAGLRRYTVAADAPADGCSLADLDLGEYAWVSMINRGGSLVAARSDTVLRSGDEVLLVADAHGGPWHHLDGLFSDEHGVARED